MVNLQMKDPARAVEEGAWGLRDRGCPRLPETMGYWAVALATVGRWDDAIDVISGMPADPFGHRIIIASAHAVLRQDFARYDAIEANWKASEPLAPHVMRLLEGAGERQSAELLGAWKAGRLKKVDPTTLDREAVEAAGGQVIQIPNRP